MKWTHRRIIEDVYARLFSLRQRRCTLIASVSFRRDRGDAHKQDMSPLVEIEETHIHKRCLLSSRQRRYGFTARVSFSRDKGDAHWQHASTFVKAEEMCIMEVLYASSMLSSCKDSVFVPVTKGPMWAQRNNYFSWLVTSSLFVWLVADGRWWFVLRKKYCWLVAGGWFVLREKYCWLVADKPNEQGVVVLTVFIRCPLQIRVIINTHLSVDFVRLFVTRFVTGALSVAKDHLCPLPMWVFHIVVSASTMGVVAAVRSPSTRSWSWRRGGQRTWSSTDM
jgi:hypothetical protein